MTKGVCDEEPEYLHSESKTCVNFRVPEVTEVPKSFMWFSVLWALGSLLLVSYYLHK